MSEKFVVWHTGVGNNEYMVSAFERGLRACGVPFESRSASTYDGHPRPSVSYGMLRGVCKIYQDCSKAKVEWWNIDHGFFKRSRQDTFDGYYRIGRNALTPSFWPKAIESGSRWRKLRIEPAPWAWKAVGPIILCPPTDAMSSFFGVSAEAWVKQTVGKIHPNLRHLAKVRLKSDKIPIQKALRSARAVAVFNSNVAVEALVAGIPAVADEGIVRSWNNFGAERLHEDFTKLDRNILFRAAAECQFTIAEMRSGLAWKRCNEVQG
jgi:hypothetical protein